MHLFSPSRPTPRDVAQRMIEGGLDLRVVRELLQQAADVVDEQAKLEQLMRRLAAHGRRRSVRPDAASS